MYTPREGGTQCILASERLSDQETTAVHMIEYTEGDFLLDASSELTAASLPPKWLPSLEKKGVQTGRKWGNQGILLLVFSNISMFLVVND